MRRKFLLATTAAAALLAAAGLGAAQSTHEGVPGAGNTPQAQGPAGAQENRGTEQRGEVNTRMKSDREMGAGNRENNQRSQQMGAGSEERNQRNQEMGAGNKEQIQHNQRSEENNPRKSQRSEGTGEQNREGNRGGVNHEGAGPSRAQSNENLHGPGRAQSNEGMSPRSEQGGNRFESARSVRLSPQQRTKIRDTFTHEHVQRVEHPDFALRVGTVVPRDVQNYDVPEDIIVLVPEYRGLKYIIVRNEVVFLDPDTLQIVAIMPA
jgi:hypothetical protein